MDPFTLAFAAISIGGKIGQMFTSSQQSDVAQQQAKLSQDEAQQELGINQQKQQAMELDASRRQMENFRNIQRARAQGVNAAVSQGAQYGSGLQGGQAAAQDQGQVNALGISQNLQIGRAIGQFNNNISNDKMQNAALGGEMANLQGQSAMYGSIASIGSSLMGMGSTPSNVMGSMGSFATKATNLFSGGSLSGGFGNT